MAGIFTLSLCGLHHRQHWSELAVRPLYWIGTLLLPKGAIAEDWAFLGCICKRGHLAFWWNPSHRQNVRRRSGANPEDTVTYEEVVGSQLQAKFVEQVTQAISVVMRKHKVSFGDISLYNSDISNEMNVCLDESWRKNYGLEITDVAIGDINLTADSMTKVNKIDEATIFSNKNLQSGLMASASADALRNASSNENGAMMGFMGMNMASGAAGSMMNAANQGSDVAGYQPGNQQPEMGTIFGRTEEPIVEIKEEETKECPECHTKGTGKFCSNCGAKLD